MKVVTLRYHSILSLGRVDHLLTIELVQKLLAICPVADGLDHLILLSDIQELVLENQLEIVLAQISDFWVIDEVREVAAYE